MRICPLGQKIGTADGLISLSYPPSLYLDLGDFGGDIPDLGLQLDNGLPAPLRTVLYNFNLSKLRTLFRVRNLAGFA